MSQVDIEIVCPKCGKKAAFFANSWRSYISRPSHRGKISCIHCCYYQARCTRKDITYYYAIPIKKRFLFARTLEDLMELKEHFKQDKRNYFEPEFDFPKVFYQHRLVLVARIEKRIAQELNQQK